MIRTQMLRESLAALACAVLAAAISAAALAVEPGSKGLWKGYLTLLVGPGVAYSDALQKCGTRSWVDRQRAPVSFTVFRGNEQVSVAALQARLDVLDPRLDPYMRSLQAWFDAGSGWSVVYVPLDRPSPFLAFDLLTHLRGYGRQWRLADWAPATGTLAVLAAAALVTGFALARPDDRGRVIGLAAAAAGWAPLLSRGNPSDLAAFLLLAAAWTPAAAAALEAARGFLARRGAAQLPGLGRFVPFGACAAVVASGGLLAGVSSGPPLILALLFPAGMVLAAAVERLASVLRPHAVFRPLRLGAHDEPEPEPSRVGRLAGFMPLLPAVVILALSLWPGPNLRLPVPQRLRGEPRYTWPVLQRLWTEGAASPLPDLADYVVHTAYQQALAYGRPYGFPAGDVVLPSFAAGRTPGSIELRDEVVVRYDAHWLEWALNEAAPGSVERLLLDQRSPVRVKYWTLGAVSPGLLLWNCVMIALYGALVFFPVGSLHAALARRARPADSP